MPTLTLLLEAVEELYVADRAWSFLNWLSHMRFNFTPVPRLSLYPTTTHSDTPPPTGPKQCFQLRITRLPLIPPCMCGAGSWSGGGRETDLQMEEG